MMTNEEKTEILAEHFRYWNVEDTDWHEDITNHWKNEKLPAEGFEDAEISFSGFWSQGDGASFTCNIDVRKFITAHLKETIEQHAHDIFKLRSFLHGDTCNHFGEIEICASIGRNCSHYCHDNTMTISYEPNLYDLDPDENKEAGNDPFIRFLSEEKKLETWLLEHAQDLAREIYRELRTEYEYLTSDEAILESLQVNGILDDDFHIMDGTYIEEILQAA